MQDKTGLTTIRCGYCNKRIGEVLMPKIYVFKCPRCRKYITHCGTFTKEPVDELLKPQV